MLKISRFILSPKGKSCLCSIHAKICRATYKTWEPSAESVYTEDHVQLVRSLSKIIERDINPFVDEWEEKKDFPAHKIFKILGNAGFLGVNKPVEYGGLGLDYSYSMTVSEELGTIKCGGVPMAIGLQTDVATPALARFGSHEVKEKFLRPSISGDVVSCLGVSEAGSGSDVANIKTHARREGNELVINGEKMWITNGAQADWCCLLAKTNDGPSHSSMSLICVPMDSPGVTVARRIEKIGMHSSDTAHLIFENVRVPYSNIIGEEGMGFTCQMIQFQEERLCAGIGSLKCMERAINETIEYTSQRQIHGGSVLSNQVVHFRLAELQTEVELLRSLIYRAAGLYMEGHDVTALASMVKLKAGRLNREVADSCLQYWGGMGFTYENIVSRMYRDARLWSIGGGADEVMLSIISKYMGTLPKTGKKQQAAKS